VNLAWQDYAIIVAYLGFTLLVGLITSQRQHSNEEYFLARRELPWWAIGLSLLATLLPGLGLLATPGEITSATLMKAMAQTMAVPVALAVVWLFAIPFLKRFRITSVYDYLEYRFNYPTRLLGVGLFLILSLGWMGWFVHSASLALSQFTGVSGGLLIAALGIVTTVYTVMGGLRASVWASAVQMLLMIGGGILFAAFIASRTDSSPWDWYREATRVQAATGGTTSFFATSLFHSESVLTMALSLSVWHLCMHCGNQSTVQRYLATQNTASARASLLVASIGALIVQMLLLALSLGILFWASKESGVLGGKSGIAMTAARLPPGLPGVVLTAVLAGAMAAVSSGLNSFATVLCLERERRAPRSRYSPGAGQVKPDSDSLLAPARWITFLAGSAVTVAAFAVSQSSSSVWVEWLSRAFPCLLAPLGTIFLLGLFFPFITGRAIVPATLLGIATGFSMAFTQELWGFHTSIDPIWVLPGTIWTMGLAAVVLSLLDRPKPQQTFGLTVFTQHQEVLFDTPMTPREAAV
jgi:SSS family solute:Na+ symporter